MLISFAEVFGTSWDGGVVSSLGLVVGSLSWAMWWLLSFCGVGLASLSLEEWWAFASARGGGGLGSLLVVVAFLFVGWWWWLVLVNPDVFQRKFNKMENGCCFLLPKSLWVVVTSLLVGSPSGGDRFSFLWVVGWWRWLA